MTNRKSLSTADDVFNMFARHLLGFEDDWKRWNTIANISSNFPPENIYQTEKGFEIEIAVAGFSKEDMEIMVTPQNVLTVVGEKKPVKDDSRKTIYQGIGYRKFTKTWQLSDHDELKDAKLEDGLLKIVIERKPPVDNTRRITIS